MFLDRARGCLLGLAVGDAIGTTLEFSARDTRPPLTDMIGGGPFGLPAGAWTDDTSMALCVGESLVHADGFDPADMMNRFVNWYRYGHNSVTGECFDIGIATRKALERYERTGDPFAGSTDPMTAGNGSVMRLAPVAIRYAGDIDIASMVAEQHSRLTHAAPEAIAGCRELTQILVSLMKGEPLRVDPALASRTRGEIRSSGYVRHTLEAALWSVANTNSFAEAVLLAANLGDDADTVGAVTGQIAGALYGADTIPSGWLDKLAWRDTITGLAETLAMRSGRSTG